MTESDMESELGLLDVHLTLAETAELVNRLWNCRQHGQTTVMVQNVPFSLSQQELVGFWANQGALTSAVLLHLPVNRRKLTNLGYCFVDFATPEAAKDFAVAVDDTAVEGHWQAKRLTTSFARVQGFRANVANLQASPANRAAPSPVVLDPDTGVSGELSILGSDLAVDAKLAGRLLAIVHPLCPSEHVARMVVGRVVDAFAGRATGAAALVDGLKSAAAQRAFVQQQLSQGWAQLVTMPCVLVGVPC
jgi:hypothetical protein